MDNTAVSAGKVDMVDNILVEKHHTAMDRTQDRSKMEGPVQGKNAGLGEVNEHKAAIHVCCNPKRSPSPENYLSLKYMNY